MLVSVFAVPTAYSEWIIHLCGRMLECKFGAYHSIFANKLNDLRAAWDDRDGRAVLLTTDWPDIEFSSFLIESGCPCVIVADDALNTVLARFPHTDIIEAIRIASGHLATLSPAFQHDRLIRIDTQFLRQPVESLLRALSNALFGEADEGVIEAVKAGVAPNEPGSLVQDLVDGYHGAKRSVDDLLGNLTSEQKAAAMSIAESYGQLVRDGAVQKVDWPLELFQFSTPGHNLLGGGRRIAWGPFLNLPSGTWRATIQCETAENFSTNELGAEIWAPRGRKVFQGVLLLPLRGIFDFWVDFDVVDPTDYVELVLFLPRGAIEGKFKLRRVSVERIVSKNREKPLELLGPSD